MRGGMTSAQLRLVAILAAILVAALARLVPHPPNFTPVGAMALFSGAYLARRGALAFAAPMGAMLLSDLFLGFYTGMLFTYVALALVVLIGAARLRRVTAVRVAGGAIAAALAFFIVSNFGVWLLSGMYPPTLSGLAACYVAAIPFFQNTLAGDLIYSALLFGGFALLERAVPGLRGGASVATAPANG